jgi:hypothetical protein
MAQSHKRKSSDLPANADDQEQSRLFIEKAREMGADKEHTRADELIGRLAKKSPEPRKKPQ